MNSKSLILIASAVACTSSLFAGTIDFEAATAGQDIGSFYQGITFTAGTEASGQTIVVGNPSASFPAHSGVQFANTTIFTETMGFTFATPQSTMSFWYDDEFGITVDLYDQNGNLINGSVGTDLAATAGVNTLYSVTPGTDISSVTITDDGQIGNDFTIDDLSAPGLTGLSAPEATSTLALLGAVGLGLFAIRRKFATQN